MVLRPWQERVRDPLVEADTISRIANSEDLIRHFGRWPTFEDAEVVALDFDRGNHLAIADRGAWDERQPPTLVATFYVFDAEVSRESVDRRPAHVALAFSDLHLATIEGLHHQNPILGLVIHMEGIDRLKAPCFRVEWGGTSAHEVSLLCSAIAVRSVVPLDPSSGENE